MGWGGRGTKFFAFETFVVEKYSGYVFTLNVYCNLFE